jgi:hypothetical protein
LARQLTCQLMLMLLLVPVVMPVVVFWFCPAKIFWAL